MQLILLNDYQMFRLQIVNSLLYLRELLKIELVIL